MLTESEKVTMGFWLSRFAPKKQDLPPTAITDYLVDAINSSALSLPDFASAMGTETWCLMVMIEGLGIPTDRHVQKLQRLTGKKAPAKGKSLPLVDPFSQLPCCEHKTFSDTLEGKPGAYPISTWGTRQLFQVWDRNAMKSVKRRLIKQGWNEDDVREVVAHQACDNMVYAPAPAEPAYRWITEDRKRRKARESLGQVTQNKNSDYMRLAVMKRKDTLRKRAQILAQGPVPHYKFDDI